MQSLKKYIDQTPANMLIVIGLFFISFSIDFLQIYYHYFTLKDGKEFFGMEIQLFMALEIFIIILVIYTIKIRSRKLLIIVYIFLGLTLFVIYDNPTKYNSKINYLDLAFHSTLAVSYLTIIFLLKTKKVHDWFINKPKSFKKKEKVFFFSLFAFIFLIVYLVFTLIFYDEKEVIKIEKQIEEKKFSRAFDVAQPIVLDESAGADMRANAIYLQAYSLFARKRLKEARKKIYSVFIIKPGF